MGGHDAADPVAWWCVRGGRPTSPLRDRPGTRDASVEDGIAAIRDTRESVSTLHDSIGPRIEAYIEVVNKCL